MAGTERFDELENSEGLKTPLVVSVVLHSLLFASALLLPGFLGRGSQDSWGGSGIGGGEAMNANLVSSIPLPANPQATNVLATESKGLTQSEPKPQVKEPDAIKIPDKDVKIKASKTPTTPTNRKPVEVASLENKVPFGEGGPVSGPYGSFTATNAKGGFGFNGGGGDFGNKYSWYVDQVRRKVSENWMKYEVDPNISTARRVYIYFEITRGGAPANIRVEQSSGIPSLDQSATRALQRIDTFGPLPPGYGGSMVAVEFWFDYRR
jgi:protein TonB